jgi:farnesyl diphosphate synthase
MGEQNDQLKAALANAAAITRDRLENLLSDRPRDGEVIRPRRLLDAMRHGVFNGGKRLRPFFVLETADAYGAEAEAALDIAAALECIHCYSLIHDDLPAMDDDDLRRGQPTVHRAFDEATAILAGDALLTLAFDAIAGSSSSLSDRSRMVLVRELARAAGIGGMAGGQMLDILAETGKPDEAAIIRLQAMKTGALLRFACRAGPILGGASALEIERMEAFGEAVGLAYQIADDILDITATTTVMGKRTGKDGEAGKATLVALNGIDWARRQLDDIVDQAATLVEPLGASGLRLAAAAKYVATRSA